MKKESGESLCPLNVLFSINAQNSPLVKLIYIFLPGLNVLTNMGPNIKQL